MTTGDITRTVRQFYLRMLTFPALIVLIAVLFAAPLAIVFNGFYYSNEPMTDMNILGSVSAFELTFLLSTVFFIPAAPLAFTLESDPGTADVLKMTPIGKTKRYAGLFLAVFTLHALIYITSVLGIYLALTAAWGPLPTNVHNGLIGASLNSYFSSLAMTGLFISVSMVALNLQRSISVSSVLFVATFIGSNIVRMYSARTDKTEITIYNYLFPHLNVLTGSEIIINGGDEFWGFIKASFVVFAVTIVFSLIYWRWRYVE